MNNCEKIIGADLLRKPKEGGKKTRFLTVFYQKVVYGDKLFLPIGNPNQKVELQKIFFEKTTL